MSLHLQPVSFLYCKMLNILMDRDIPELFILDCCSIYTLCRGMAFIASNFPLKMAYRQGGKISPILFFVYLDGLL